MKYEWKKQEKSIYLPSALPQTITLPPYKYYVISGTGDPNSEPFKLRVSFLYKLAYGIRMLPKKGMIPEGYYEYTVYPLEGIWGYRDDFSASGQDKASFTYQIMIRQPDFVNESLASANCVAIKQKFPEFASINPLFMHIEDGLCVQMMHIGSYDDEPASFAKMMAYCDENNLERRTATHREIYIGDPNRGSIDQLKTVLRYFVQQ